MLPIPGASFAPSAIDFPTLPPQPSGPNPSAPGSFSRLYDSLATETDKIVGSKPVLPTAMEMRIPVAPAADLSQPFVASAEFAGTQLGNQARNHAHHPFEFLAPLKDGLDQVTQLVRSSEALTNEAAIGGDVDLHDVMIAAEKSGVAMQLTLQVRNKLVEAYQDVMRMQV